MNAVDNLAERRDREPERIGPYMLYSEIGCGGMASVHLGKLQSSSGFSRVVAIKRMHSDLSRSPEFVEMFFEEARLVSRIQHPNVVAALDCVAVDSTVMLVMDYVHGVSLDQVARSKLSRGEIVPAGIAASIIIGAALGLHAAHEAVDETGKSLGIVHRDVSPHNILVGEDGVARVLDFGIAKAAERAHHTRTGEVKGKIGYMAPEQLLGGDVGREADVYSLGVILWELLTGRRLFGSDGQGQMLMKIANSQLDRPSEVNPSVTPEAEAMVMKALARSPDARFRTALDLVVAIEGCMPQAGQRAVGEWVKTVGLEELEHRSAIRSHMDLSMPSRIRDARDLTGRRRYSKPKAEAGDPGHPPERGAAQATSRLGQVLVFMAGVGVAAVAATLIARGPHSAAAGSPTLVTKSSETAKASPAPGPAAPEMPSRPIAASSATAAEGVTPATTPTPTPFEDTGIPAREAPRPAIAGSSRATARVTPRTATPTANDAGAAAAHPVSSAASSKALELGAIGGRE